LQIQGVQLACKEQQDFRSLFQIFSEEPVLAERRIMLHLLGLQTLQSVVLQDHEV